MEPLLRTDRLERALLWMGALAPILVAVIVLASASLTPGYSHVSDTISQLGAREAPHPMLIQIGLVGWGLLLEGLAWGLYRRLGKGSGARSVLVLLMVSGASVQLAAIIRDDPNVPSAASTIGGAVHGFLATLAFAGLLAAIVAFARTVHPNP